MDYGHCKGKNKDTMEPGEATGDLWKNSTTGQGRDTDDQLQLLKEIMEAAFFFGRNL